MAVTVKYASVRKLAGEWGPDSVLIRLYTENVGHPPVNLYTEGLAAAQWNYKGASDATQRVLTLSKLTGGEFTLKPARRPAARKPVVKLAPALAPCPHDLVNVFTGCCNGCGEARRIAA